MLVVLVERLLEIGELVNFDPRFDHLQIVILVSIPVLCIVVFEVLHVVLFLQVDLRM